MQNLVYDEAPYHILYYDAELHAYRTDKFAGWTNQPTEGGTPLFGYGSLGYTLLTDASLAPSPAPTESAAAPSAGSAATPAPSTGGTPAPASSSGDSTTLLVVGAIVVIAVVVGLFLAMRRRGAAADDE